MQIRILLIKNQKISYFSNFYTYIDSSWLYWENKVSCETSRLLYMAGISHLKKILRLTLILCLLSFSIVSDTASTWTVARQTTFLCPRNSPCKNTDFLLQGIFPTQGLNLDFLHCRQILYCLSNQGSPLRVPWKARRSNYSILKEINPE